jgi:hypothetical protein
MTPLTSFTSITTRALDRSASQLHPSNDAETGASSAQVTTGDRATTRSLTASGAGPVPPIRPPPRALPSSALTGASDRHDQTAAPEAPPALTSGSPRSRSSARPPSGRLSLGASRDRPPGCDVGFGLTESWISTWPTLVALLDQSSGRGQVVAFRAGRPCPRPQLMIRSGCMRISGVGSVIASARPRTSTARGRQGSVLSRSSMTIAARPLRATSRNFFDISRSRPPMSIVSRAAL